MDNSMMEDEIPLAPFVKTGAGEDIPTVPFAVGVDDNIPSAPFLAARPDMMKGHATPAPSLMRGTPAARPTADKSVTGIGGTPGATLPSYERIPQPSISPAIDLALARYKKKESVNPADRFYGALRSTYDWGRKKFTAAGHFGMTDEEFAALPATEKLAKLAQFEAEKATDIPMAGGRGLMKMGRGLLSVGKTAAEKTSRLYDTAYGWGYGDQAGTAPGTDEFRSMLSDIAPEQWDTGGSPFEEQLQHPTTVAGEAAQPVTDAALQTMLAIGSGGTAPMATSRMLNTAAFFGAKDASSAYAGSSGADESKRNDAAAASGILGALSTVVPTTPFLRGTGAKILGDNFIGKNLFPAVGEGLGFALAQGRINQVLDPNAPLITPGSFAESVATVLGMQQLGHHLNNAGVVPQALPSWDSGVPRLRGVGRLGVEQKFSNLAGMTQADQMRALAYMKYFNDNYAPEVRAEVSAYVAQQEAGLSTPKLSPAAEKLMADPAFVQTVQAQRTRYEAAAAEKGKQAKPNGPYLPRIVVEGVEPTSTGYTGGGLGGTVEDRSIVAMNQLYGGNDRLIGARVGRNFVTKDGLTLKRVPVAEALDFIESTLKQQGKERVDDIYLKAKQEVLDADAALEALYESTAGRQTKDKNANTTEYKNAVTAAENRLADAVQKYMVIRLPERNAFNQTMSVANPVDANLVGMWHLLDAAGKGGGVYRTSQKGGTPRTFTMGQATPAEITDTYGIKYRNDAPLDLIDSIMGMGKGLRERDLFKELEADGRYLTDKSKNKTGLVALDSDPQYSDLLRRYPYLKDKAIDPRVADTLLGMIRPPNPNMKDKEFFDNVNGYLTQLGFAIPTVHWPNMIGHFFKSLGIEGMTKGVATGRVQKNMDRAARALASITSGNPNQDAIDLADAGMKYMTGSKVGDDYSKLMGENASINFREPESRTDYKGLGGVSRMNRAATWTPDDFFRATLVLEKAERYGLSLSDAVKEVDRTYPSYKLYRNQFNASGNTGQTAEDMLYNLAQNRMLLFMRYRTGAWKSLLTTAKDLVPGANASEPKSVRDSRLGSAYDKAAGLGVSTAGIGVGANALIRALTGDDDTEYRHGGTAHIISGAMDATRGLREASEFGANQFIPTPISRVVFDTMSGKDWSNRRDLDDAIMLASMGKYDEASKSLRHGAGDALRGLIRNMNFSATQAEKAVGGSQDVSTTVARMLLAGKASGTKSEKLAKRLFFAESPHTTPARLGSQPDSAAVRFKFQEAQDDPEKFSLAIDEAIQSGFAPDKIVKMAKEYGISKEMMLAGMVGRMRPFDAIHVLSASNEKERMYLLPVVLKKVQSLPQNTEEAAKQKILAVEMFDKLMQRR